MFDYSGLEFTATQLIAEFGRDCTITVELDSEYDVETSEVVAVREIRNGQCVIFGLTEDYAAQFAAGGNLVERGDAVIWTTAAADPENGCLLEVGGEVWRILGVYPIRPAGTVLAYKTHARKESP